MQFMMGARQHAQKLLQENASTILTAAGVVGTVATAVITGKAAIKAHQIITDERVRKYVAGYSSIGVDGVISDDVRDIVPEDELPELDRLEKLRLVAPIFLPPVLLGTLTVASIIFANRISARNAAALAAAYGLSEKQLREYKEKLAERLTPQKQQDIESAIAQDQLNNTPGVGQVVVIEGEVLCFDASGGRYFNSTMEKIRQAVNNANEEIVKYDTVSLSQFYDSLGLNPTRWSDDLGFNMDNRVELKYSTQIADNGKPCIVIDFANMPRPDFHRTYN